MRVALVHDWLVALRGGEKVLHELALLYPHADLFTLVHAPGSTTPEIERLRIRESPLARLPNARSAHRAWLPLYPWAIERLELSGYDLVISVSHAVAKGVRSPAPHLCYCLTPMRYIWDQIDLYLGRGARRALAQPLVRYLRRWDRRTSTPERVQQFVAISHEIAQRIRTHYGREAPVLYPPVDVERFTPAPGARGEFFLLVGGFVPYKQEGLALDAFAQLGLPLVVAGDGPARRALERRAPPNVRFVGRVDDRELADLYRRCRALVYPQREDFGIIPVEAQACGRPVIAFGAGGARETVVGIDDPAGAAPTGVFFDTPRPEALCQAVAEFERVESDLDPSRIRKHAERFSRARFREEFTAAVDAFVARHGAASGG